MKRVNHGLKDCGWEYLTSKGTRGVLGTQGHFFGFMEVFTPTKRDHLLVAADGGKAEPLVGQKVSCCRWSRQGGSLRGSDPRGEVKHWTAYPSHRTNDRAKECHKKTHLARDLMQGIY